MNFIAQGGITSKNVPSSSKDAFLLALHTNYIQGIAVNVHLSKDDKVVICKQNFLNHISNGHGRIKNHTLEHLKRINFGNKIKRQDIATLEEILALFQNSTKLLIIHLTDEKNPERNKRLMDEMVSCIKKYPNINLYIKSKNLDMILYLNKLNIKAKIGLCLSQENLSNVSSTLDFYSIQATNVSTSFINKALQNHQFILLENITSKEQLSTIHNELEPMTENIFIITEQIFPLVSFYLNHFNPS